MSVRDFEIQYQSEPLTLDTDPLSAVMMSTMETAIRPADTLWQVLHIPGGWGNRIRIQDLHPDVSFVAYGEVWMQPDPGLPEGDKLFKLVRQARAGGGEVWKIQVIQVVYTTDVGDYVSARDLDWDL